MKKEKCLAISILIVLLFSFFISSVSAVGRTTSGYERDSETQRVCANLDSVESRVKCRLEQREAGPSIPEACRNLGITEKERCRVFYSESRECYYREGREKDACFRRVSGLGTAVISGEAEKTSMRNYIITLLYDLEERAEMKFDSGEITAEQTAELIALITDIKEKILSQAPRSEIRPMLQDLRIKWNEVMQ